MAYDSKTNNTTIEKHTNYYAANDLHYAENMFLYGTPERFRSVFSALKGQRPSQ